MGKKQKTNGQTPQSGAASEKEVIRLSVRNLVEFVFRSGDLDNRVGAGVSAEVMQEGSRMHRKIQRRRGSGYRAEVSLKQELDMGNYVLLLEGRADGIFCRNEKPATERFLSGASEDEGQEDPAAPRTENEEDPVWFIDEIKSMYTDVMRFEEPLPVHLAQAKTYACLYALQNELDGMGVQITYCNLDTEEVRQFEEIFSSAALRDWFEEMIASYRRWTDFQWEWRQIRQGSIKATEFPFPYREGQKKLVSDVYRTVLREKILFLQAPTGTGKTMATVFPAVKAMGEGLTEKIFYLTARTITRTVAKEAFDTLKADGLQMKVLTLTAKEKLCPLEEMDCNPVHCPRAKGHFDRVNDAVFELMTTKSDYTREALLTQAERHQVCPFEMALDLSLWSDAVICDYNYVFDPNVSLRRFFAEGEQGDYLFLVDEAHNLVERGREMYSACLVKEEFLSCKKILKNRNTKIVSALDRCNRQMLDWKRSCEDYTVYDTVGNFVFSLLHLTTLLDEFLRKSGEFPGRKDVTEFYFSVRHFLAMYDRMDENDVLYGDFDDAGRFRLHLCCVNPAANLQECMDRGRSAVFFSATLLPIGYYKRLLSTRSDNYAVYADTSFSKEQRLLFVARDVSSLYKRRGTTEYQRIASYIATVARARRGNYIVYFPSYRFMEEVYDEFVELMRGTPSLMSAEMAESENVLSREGRGTENVSSAEGRGTENAASEMEGVVCLLQEANMSEEEREAFLAEFSRERAGSLVAFCVLGGIFAEGIDLPDERLIGVLVVGTGLPQICTEREILKRYYDGEFIEAEPDGKAVSGGGREVYAPGRSGEGFAYAYQYPGMNKVMQAAGRVIRTATDVGVIGLLDERFLRRDYRELFPREWEDARTCRLETLPGLLEEFWSAKE